MTTPPHPQRVLVTGASGYIGGRLVRWLDERGHHVRAMARQPSVLGQKAVSDVGTSLLRKVP